MHLPHHAISILLKYPGQTADNSHCSVSPASAFAIATAAAGHGSPPGEWGRAVERLAVNCPDLWQFGGNQWSLPASILIIHWAAS